MEHAIVFAALLTIQTTTITLWQMILVYFICKHQFRPEIVQFQHVYPLPVLVETSYQEKH
jgi:hypothetical protein